MTAPAQLNRTTVYFDYLQSEHWQDLRLRVFNRASRKCEYCGSPDQLQGHHLRYRSLTDCTEEDVMCLCDRCHRTWHHEHNSSVVATREQVLDFLMNPAVFTPKHAKPKKRKNLRTSNKAQRKEGRLKFKSIRAAFRKLTNSDHTKQALDEFIREVQRMRPTLPDR